MMIKLVLTDLDGTFLNSSGTFDADRFKKILSALIEKEIAFGVVTGKQTERVEELFGDLSKKIWILGDSASRIKFNGKFEFQQLIPNAQGKQLIQKLEEIHADQTIIACTESAAIIKESRAELDGELVRRSYAVMKTVKDFSEITDDFVKVTVFDRQKRCYASFEQLKAEQEQFYIVASEAAWLDITSKGIHKGTTVQKLQELLSVSVSETMAFGDGYNDFELLAQAKFSYAMANAFPEVQAKADFIAPSNDESGVLTVIEQKLIK